MLRGPGSFIGPLAIHCLPYGTSQEVDTGRRVLIAGQSTAGQLIATVLRSALAEPGVWPRGRGAEEAGLAARASAAMALRAVARRLPDARLVDEMAERPMLGLSSVRAPLRIAVHQAP
ncbi:hypothetical protein [Streptomyces violaceusniger]|uniref:hypothetical protein n=1 Tax=Streptomyces violaceusniger TaxID=68280 RepID=UPI0009967FA8|nr:hypothetical protein [Streptomyces hygroscopicus]AQW46611.1 cytochrome P450 [Streptomyces hygroscopicus]